MIFKQTHVEDVFVVGLEKRSDERGFFARSFCAREFEAHGLNPNVVQSNVSLSREVGTLRGMHYQIAPHRETKLVRCTRGAIFDVALDLRPDSPSFRSWVGLELTPDRDEMLYIPQGCAHGFLTLVPDSEVSYHVSGFYAPECERGVRFDDPAFGIDWPGEIRVLSQKDVSWPLWEVDR